METLSKTSFLTTKHINNKEITKQYPFYDSDDSLPTPKKQLNLQHDLWKLIKENTN